MMERLISRGEIGGIISFGEHHGSLMILAANTFVDCLASLFSG
jgi:hypothetical protein